jgi:hypothetical protein
VTAPEHGAHAGRRQRSEQRGGARRRSQHTCALPAGGTVRCWGCEWRGAARDGTTTSQPTPIAASGVFNGRAGGQVSHTRAPRGWHGPLLGLEQLRSARDGTVVPRPVPVTVSGLSGAVAITARNLPYMRTAGQRRRALLASNASGELGTEHHPTAHAGRRQRPHQCGGRDRGTLHTRTQRGRVAAGARTAPVSSAMALARDS